MPKRMKTAKPQWCFIGAGNMARAVLRGAAAAGQLAGVDLCVVAPSEQTRAAMRSEFAAMTFASLADWPADAPPPQCVVWAVKPQQFLAASTALPTNWRASLHISVMAALTIDLLRRRLQAKRIIRAMPNTPCLIAQGMSALYAADAVTQEEREWAEKLLGACGQTLWLEREEQMDAAAALSGCGPAYGFYFAEAMQRAGEALGLPAEMARRLALAALAGGAALALARPEQSLTQLRAQVASKGGMTEAALGALEAARVQEHFIAAIHAAHQRAGELAVSASRG